MAYESSLGVQQYENSFVDRLLDIGRRLCSKEQVDVGGITYVVKEKIAEG